MKRLVIRQTYRCKRRSRVVNWGLKCTIMGCIYVSVALSLYNIQHRCSHFKIASRIRELLKNYWVTEQSKTSAVNSTRSHCKRGRESLCPVHQFL